VEAMLLILFLKSSCKQNALRCSTFWYVKLTLFFLFVFQNCQVSVPDFITCTFNFWYCISLDPVLSSSFISYSSNPQRVQSQHHGIWN